MLDHPHLAVVDITGRIDLRFTRVVYRIDERSRELVELFINEDKQDFWQRLSGTDLEYFSRLTLSTMYSPPSAEVLKRIGTTLTYLDVANVSWKSLPWTTILKEFARLNWLRIEQTKPVYRVEAIMVSEVEQIRRLQEYLLDILPGLAGSLLCLENIELVTSMPMDAGSLVKFLSSQTKQLRLEAKEIHIFITRKTLVDSELDALREMAVVIVI